jgi:hypothetical protein
VICRNLLASKWLEISCLGKSQNVAGLRCVLIAKGTCDLAMLEEGELQGFLAASDKKSAKQKKLLIKTLQKFSATLDADVLAIRENTASGCLPDLLCFRQCGWLIQWTCL